MTIRLAKPAATQELLARLGFDPQPSTTPSPFALELVSDGCEAGLAVVSLGSDGAAVLLALDADSESAREALAAAVVKTAFARGARFVQSVQPVGDLPFRHWTHLTDLQFFAQLIDSSVARSGSRPRSVRAIPYRDDDRIRFESLLDECFTKSLDCPEVRAVQTVSQSLRGMAIGSANGTAGWYRIASDNADEGDLGLLLLAERALIDAWEIAYLGVRPQSRGRGVASEALAIAIDMAIAARVKLLFLAVDIRNEPAIRLYRKCGFELADRHQLWVALGDQQVSDRLESDQP